MAVRFSDLKKWSKQFGFGGFGMKKDVLIKGLIKYMKENPDELDEEQLGWYEMETGACLAGKVVKKPKKLAKKEVEEEKPKLLKKPKKIVEEVEEEEEEEKSEGIELEPKVLKKYADELEISTKKVKSEEDYQELAQKIFETVDAMEEEEKEALSKKLFNFYTLVKGQTVEGEEEEPEEEEKEKEMPSPVKLKVWLNALGLRKKKEEDPEDTIERITNAYNELDEESKTDLPESLKEFIGEGTVEEKEEEEPEVVTPDYKILKKWGKAVGMDLDDIKELKDDPDQLAETILGEYDEDEEDSYPDELVEFYSVAGKGTKKEKEEEEPEEKTTDRQVMMNYLIECGYDKDDMEDADDEDLLNTMKSEYEESKDENLSEDAIAFLKENAPELFKKEKKLLKKKLLKK